MIASERYRVKCRHTGWLCLLLALIALPGYAVDPGEPKSPEAVLARAEATFRDLQDYECVVESEARKGKRHEFCVQRLWFKKPLQMRLRVLRGDHRGSEVALDANRKVRGHAGGILKPLVLGVRFNDSRLKSLRGHHFSELNWGAFYTTYRQHAALPQARAVLSRRTSSDAPYEIVLTYTRDGHATREYYRFDPRLWVLLEHDMYEDEVHVDHTRFSEIRLNPGLKDSWFRL